MLEQEDATMIEDETRWMATTVELIALAAALLFAWLQAT
jgi:hypothetical protein